MYITACNMLTLSTQYLVNKTLLTNPQMFVEKVHATEVSDQEFKNVGDIKSMKKFLISACTAGKKRPTGNAKKSLLEAFDSSSEEEEAKGEQQSSSTEECDESSSEDSSDSSSEESENAAEEETEKVAMLLLLLNTSTKYKVRKLQRNFSFLCNLFVAGKKRRGEEAAEDFQPLQMSNLQIMTWWKLTKCSPPKKKHKKNK